MGRMTNAQRQAAAVRAAAARQSKQSGTVGQSAGALLTTRDLVPAVLNPGGVPDYFGIGNYANSPLPTVAGGVITGGIRKFVDTLPGLGLPGCATPEACNANNLGQFIPIADKDITAFPGSDYYQIGLVNYTEQMHSDLPATTKLRGYKDLSTAADGLPHYLGPLIIAQRDRPVRIKFTNMLPTSGSAGSDLFIPVDTTVMGAGLGPDGVHPYTQNRATVHLHGGATSWISDGTPHQWITPAGDTATYRKGVSQRDVPDMPDPGDGSATFYYGNEQSSRLMFYHDHAYGLTRLNVYAGEAAGYLLTDAVEEDLISGTNATGVNPGLKKVLPDLGGVYRYGVPLIIQDKTFVPDIAPGGQLASQDPTWDTTKWGGYGDLWFPHVYMPNQNPDDLSGANAFGRWDYGPFFWPPVTLAAGLLHAPIIGNGTNGCPAGLTCPATPNPSLVPEAFMDTPLVNGTAYPKMTVERKAYRFRILNASNDRTLNLQLYYVDPAHPTEVRMVPADPGTGLPDRWPTDARAGGAPDPTLVGPSLIQIGTEGGFLPAPVVLENTPIGYVYDRRNIVVLNVSNSTLMLGPAERADVIVDFSGVPEGAKLILYNDAPAPVPAFDTRLDYYTGNPDQTSTGGAPTTLEGYGPNTRTLMRFDVTGASASTAFDLVALKAALPTAFNKSQPAPIVPESAYRGGTTDTYARIQDISLTANGITYTMKRKAIHELFELNYGRMNAVLGVELPLTNFATQTTIPYGYVDPPTETIQNGQTQIWKITHNGVDTHAIHFHLFNVQLINRVGWDGAIRPPDPNELGWKETVRMNPLEDVIVALTPIAPTMPDSFGPVLGNGSRLPDSERLLDPTSPPGTTSQFSNIDPTTGNAVPGGVSNVTTNFGWEYVWHCHLLGHEENDMMRAVVFNPAPPLVGAPTVTAISPSDGPPAGGTSVIITGTSFDTTPGNTTVRIGGTLATLVAVTSTTSLTAVTPAGLAGLEADVAVMTAAGAGVLREGFGYLAAPTASGLTPLDGPTAGGTVVTITGASFLSGETTVTFGGAAATSVAITSPTTIEALTPAGAAGPASVVVTTPGAGSVTAGTFTYLDAPTATLIAPAAGLTTGGPPVVAITGTNFVAGETTVTVGGTAASGVSVTSATSLTAIVPAGTFGVAAVVVATPGGSATIAGGYTYYYRPPPSITAVTPGGGLATGGSA
ncbi:MAG: IPT/TIG domain-containing protein, partial [Planctomycetes bacterium]|nr:IPT/TIG domain-containing protein [Planctomycetota bacterium]